MNQQHNEMTAWLAKTLNKTDVKTESLSGDASFRRYFRVHSDNEKYILMDMPPEKENYHSFIHITEQLRTAGIHAPKIHAHEVNSGFALLEDFGDDLLLNVVNDDNADSIYRQAIDVLLNIQTLNAADLPPFDEKALTDEMHLFTDWYCHRHLDVQLGKQQRQIFDAAFEKLAANALEQPQVFVHRDYHSRNLMLLADGGIGVLDYQDAVSGPITYDLVSLLKDCYICLPADRLQHHVGYFLSLCRRDTDFNPTQFRRWFDLTGVQRHLKAAGIFARLCYRDNKPGYLNDIPRTLAYINQCLGDYPEFSDLHNLLKGLPDR